MSEEKMTEETMVEVIKNLADRVRDLAYDVDSLKDSHRRLINHPSNDTVRVKVNGVIIDVSTWDILRDAYIHIRDIKKHT